jgi:hypothetical protein
MAIENKSIYIIDVGSHQSSRYINTLTQKSKNLGGENSKKGRRRLGKKSEARFRSYYLHNDR